MNQARRLTDGRTVMKIPTEPIGSIPRPVELIEAIAEAGDYADQKLDPLYEKAIRETIEEFEATGSPIITDGEQRKYHNFWTYCVHGLANTGPDVSFHTGKKVLVTGAAGFLGAHLCERLRIQGCVLFGLDRNPARATGGFERFIVGELAVEAQGVLEALEPDLIFHLAGAASVPDSVRDPVRDFVSA